MYERINVLNHGYVVLAEHMGNDLSIVRAARVSYDAEARTGKDAGADAKLINYLWKNGHTSPFEHVQFTFEVKAPILVFRQWHRHRTWSFNEISARYAELPEEFYIPEPELIGQQAKSNKQMRTIDAELSDSAYVARQEQCFLAQQSMETAFETYRTLLAEGWPRELARSVLPVATYSKMTASIDLMNLMKFFSLRIHDHAQYEIRVFAEAMLELVRPIVPVAIETWEANRK